MCAAAVRHIWKIAHTKTAITTDQLTWLAVHGNLCLALRHPGNIGASRERVIQFVKQLGQVLVKEGVISPEKLAEATRLEISEGSTDLAD